MATLIFLRGLSVLTCNTTEGNNMLTKSARATLHPLWYRIFMLMIHQWRCYSLYPHLESRVVIYVYPVCGNCIFMYMQGLQACE